MKPYGPAVMCIYIKNLRRNRAVILHLHFKKMFLATGWRMGKGAITAVARPFKFKGTYGSAGNRE